MPALMCVLVAAWLAVSSPASAQEIVTLPTRPDVTQPYFLARVPKDPQVIALLFPGGGGSIRLRSEDGQIKFASGNFLVRTRGEFVKRGVVAAVLDAPSDQQAGWGMTDEFRFGEEHLTDVRAVLADLGRRFPGLPFFLVGTSRGSVSAASLGARIDRGVAGVVLKEGKRLALVVRESPFHAINLEQMLTLARSGVRIVPPIPPFYQKARTVEELVDQIVGRVLDQIGLHTDLPTRWRGTG